VTIPRFKFRVPATGLRRLVSSVISGAWHADVGLWWFDPRARPAPTDVLMLRGQSDRGPVGPRSIPFKSTVKYATPMLGTWTYQVEKIETRLPSLALFSKQQRAGEAIAVRWIRDRGSIHHQVSARQFNA
jgi:hypothetical protein